MIKALHNMLQYLAVRTVNIFPEWCFGRVSVMKEKYRMLYGQRDWDALVNKIRLRTAKAYIVLTFLFLLIVSMTLICIKEQKTVINEYIRPDAGKPGIREELTAKATYGDTEIIQKVNLKISAKELTLEEKKEALSAYRERLPTLILGNNLSLNCATTDLILPETDDVTNILIEWNSDSPELMNEYGEIDLIEARKGGIVVLTALLSLGELTEEVSFHIKIPPVVSNDYSAAVRKRLNQTIEKLDESDGTRGSIVLPSTIEGGIAIEWSKDKNRPLAEIFCMAFFGYLIIFFKRYDRMEREYKSVKDAIINDFPDFINKFVLLLNAGLVTDSALWKITADYRKFRNINNVKPLYEGLCEIEKRVVETNMPLTGELREFAKRSGVRELSRFTAIIEDNINKGSALAEKLEGESALLWLNRKRIVEEKGRLAEIKLTFPLMLLLFVLIIITTAPVILEF